MICARSDLPMGMVVLIDVAMRLRWKDRRPEVPGIVLAQRS